MNARRLAVAAVACVVVGALLDFQGPAGVRGWARHAAGQALGLARNVSRRSMRNEEPPFAHLAASQVGYGPGQGKHFSAPSAFRTFVIEDVQSGSAVFHGAGPTRTVSTDLLGPLHTVWLGDFTALATPGRYRLVTDSGLTSLPFSVGGDVFDGPLRAVQRWFYFQRAFTSVEQPYAEGPWTHPTDADKAPPGVRAGWHDAGDFSLYSASLNTAVFWLLSSFRDFCPVTDDTHIPESGNGVPDVLDEARWGLEWLLSVQDASGGFRNTTCQERYGPYGTNTPTAVPPYRDGEVGTFATARAVGNLAFASTLYRTLDPAFAKRCLAAAWEGTHYLEAHAGENTDGPTCAAARRDGDVAVGRTTRMFAAAGMLLATDEPRFRDAFEASFSEPLYDAPFLHLSGQAALLYVHAPAADATRKRMLLARLRANADVALTEGALHPFGWAGRYHWGSLGAGFLRAGLNSAPLCLENPQGASADCEQALASVHYAFGRNLDGYCYVSGLSGVSRGMVSGFHQWLAALGASPRDFPGMVAGGPCQTPEPNDTSTPQGRPIPEWGYFGDPAFPRTSTTPLDGRYTDNDSWSTNEPSVEWEAEAVYLLHFAQWLAKGHPPRSCAP